MTKKEFKEAKKMRPALIEIDRILGDSATIDQKMELFKYVQTLMGETVRRVLHDMGMLSVRKT